MSSYISESLFFRIFPRQAVFRSLLEDFNLQKYNNFDKKQYICAMSGFKKYIFNSETLSYEVDRSYTKRRAFRVVFLLVLSSLMANLHQGI